MLIDFKTNINAMRREIENNYKKMKCFSEIQSTIDGMKSILNAANKNLSELEDIAMHSIQM